MSLESLKYVAREPLQVLDQLKLPHQHEYIQVKTSEQGWTVIRNMNVRGAPAIAMVGCLSLTVELQLNPIYSAMNKEQLVNKLNDKLKHLNTARPTAVNLTRAVEDLKGILSTLLKDEKTTSYDVISSVVNYSEKLFAEDLANNKKIGQFGARHIIQNTNGKDLCVLTHCNTGSLATSGNGGTAFGVVRELHNLNALKMAYCTETRPYNQGARLTAYELVYDKIPGCLICDDMAGALMKNKNISAVVVGADRIARNGDTANKIGTYQLAVLALHHKIPFYTVAPTTTIDLSTLSGDAIPIEERNENEMVNCPCGSGYRIPPKGIGCWNPAFDVTPGHLITGGIVTEFGVVKAPLDTKQNLETLRMKIK